VTSIPRAAPVDEADPSLAGSIDGHRRAVQEPKVL
jgi:hypothetical protein